MMAECSRVVIGLCTNLSFSFFFFTYIYKRMENLLAGCLADGAGFSVFSVVTYTVFLKYVDGIHNLIS